MQNSLLTDIRSKLKVLPIEVKFFWIEGHALEKYGKESYKEGLNRICDEMAKAHRLKLTTGSTLCDQMLGYIKNIGVYTGKV